MKNAPFPPYVYKHSLPIKRSKPLLDIYHFHAPVGCPIWLSSGSKKRS